MEVNHEFLDVPLGEKVRRYGVERAGIHNQAHVRLGHPRRDPPPSRATAMRVAAIQAATKRNRLDRVCLKC